MPNLDSVEIDCLRHIARGQTAEGGPCKEDVLRRLLELGLVERVPTQCLPLEMPRSAFRLTPAAYASLGAD